MKETIHYELHRSKRKSLSLEVTRDLLVVVRAPMRMKQRDIDTFVLSHTDWIARQMDKQQHRQTTHPKPTIAEIEAQKSAAQTYIPGRVTYWSDQMGLIPAGVKITSAKARFGSCSGKNSLCFAYRLMTYPPEAIDYVVVHELAHIRHKNHGPDFYRLVAAYLPDYKARQALLKE